MMRYEFRTRIEFIAALEKMRGVVEESRRAGLDELIAAIQAKEYPQAWRVRAMVATAFSRIGESAPCRGCGQMIWWFVTRNGKRAPYTDQAISHFADCPNAGRFKR